MIKNNASVAASRQQHVAVTHHAIGRSTHRQFFFCRRLPSSTKRGTQFLCGNACDVRIQTHGHKHVMGVVSYIAFADTADTVMNSAETRAAHPVPSHHACTQISAQPFIHTHTQKRSFTEIQAQITPLFSCDTHSAHAVCSCACRGVLCLPAPVVLNN